MMLDARERLGYPHMTKIHHERWGLDMSEQNGQLITVFGGSGFLGRHVVLALAKRGYRVRAAVRRPDLAGFLQPMGTVSQVHAVQANLRYPDSVKRAMEGSHAVVNLVGIMNEGGKQTFGKVQAEGAKAVAQAAAGLGIDRVVHVSAIGADADSASLYAQSKAAGEAAVFAARPDAVILRPSLVFGPEDNFFNLFGGLSTISPVLPLIGGGTTRFQPVYVGDVAEAVARAVDGSLKAGTVYELGGPQVQTFRQLLELVLRETGRSCLLVPLPGFIAKINAWFLQLLPSPLLTVDQVKLLESDNVVSDAAITQGRTLQGMGITPAAIEAKVPGYLWRFRKGGEFSPLPR
jgi:NADH dehydrogenase